MGVERTLLELLASDFEWDEQKCGRVEGDVAAEKQLVSKHGWSLRMRGFDHLLGPMYRAGSGVPATRSSRGRTPDGREPFSLTVSHVAKRRPPRDARRPDRVYFDAPRAARDAAREIGGRIERNTGAVYAPRGSEAEAALRARYNEREGPVMTTPGPNARARGTAPAHVRYMERDAAVEILADGTPAVVSNLGETMSERAAFFTALERPRSEGGTERDDGLVQSRIIAELPHEVGAAARLRIVDRFAEVFRERGLPFTAAVHGPDRHGDARNHHVHVAYHDRPAERTGEGSWAWAPRKCRDVIGRAWLRELRERFAGAANVELERAGSARRYHPGSYAELGIAKERHLHMGPAVAAKERRGHVTFEGLHNLVAEKLWERGRTEAARSAEMERLGGAVADHRAGLEALGRVRVGRGGAETRGEEVGARLAEVIEAVEADPQGARRELEGSVRRAEALRATVRTERRRERDRAGEADAERAAWLDRLDETVSRWLDGQAGGARADGPRDARPGQDASPARRDDAAEDAAEDVARDCAGFAVQALHAWFRSNLEVARRLRRGVRAGDEERLRAELDEAEARADDKVADGLAGLIEAGVAAGLATAEAAALARRAETGEVPDPPRDSDAAWSQGLAYLHEAVLERERVRGRRETVEDDLAQGAVFDDEELARRRARRQALAAEADRVAVDIAARPGAAATLGEDAFAEVAAAAARGRAAAESRSLPRGGRGEAGEPSL